MTCGNYQIANPPTRVIKDEILYPANIPTSGLNIISSHFICALQVRVFSRLQTAVEVKDVLLPESMRRAMARRAEVERDRRAKIINAEGEFQAAERLVQAADRIAAQPIALQLRVLQTINEVSSDRTSTLVLPLPMELFGSYLNRANGQAAERTPEQQITRAAA